MSTFEFVLDQIVVLSQRKIDAAIQQSRIATRTMPDPAQNLAKTSLPASDIHRDISCHFSNILIQAPDRVITYTCTDTCTYQNRRHP